MFNVVSSIDSGFLLAKSQTYAEDFSWKKLAQFDRFQRGKNPDPQTL
jgi:hypothetical protein